MEWNHPSIIALKGFPFTGKTSLSMDLACHLRFCLLLSLDDILDAITPAAYSTTCPPPAESKKLISQAFDVLCIQAQKQLSIGQSVIIDSLPLSRLHLNRLAQLSKTAKIVILDCKINRKFAWEMRFKKKYPEDADAAERPWYTARSWKEVSNTVDDYNKGIDEYEGIDKYVGGVSRLYLNVDQEVRGRHVIEAIQTLVLCPDDRHVDYHTWSNYNLSVIHKYKYDDHGHDHGHDHDHTNCGHDHGPAKAKELFSRRLVSHTSRSCSDGHRIGVFAEKGLVGFEADCLVCENPVIGPAYACNSCQAALHKSCAELMSSRLYSPQEFPAFINKNDEKKDAYSFPENFPCFRCKESGKDYSHECSGCVFKSLLKCRLVPTMIEHDGHPHKLSLWAMKIEGKGAYTCAACGKKGAYAAYGCDGCETNYHVKCALLPHPIEDHNHGGHSHTVKLLFERDDKEYDDFPCSLCQKNMSPEDWYYNCKECAQIYHLNCAFIDEDEYEDEEEEEDDDSYY